MATRATAWFYGMWRADRNLDKAEHADLRVFRAMASVDATEPRLRGGTTGRDGTPARSRLEVVDVARDRDR